MREDSMTTRTIITKTKIHANAQNEKQPKIYENFICQYVLISNSPETLLAPPTPLWKWPSFLFLYSHTMAGPDIRDRITNGLFLCSGNFDDSTRITLSHGGVKWPFDHHSQLHKKYQFYCAIIPSQKHFTYKFAKIGVGLYPIGWETKLGQI